MGMVGIKKGKYEWDKEEKVRNEIRKVGREWDQKREDGNGIWKEEDGNGIIRGGKEEEGKRRDCNAEGGGVEVYRSFVSAFIQ